MKKVLVFVLAGLAALSLGQMNMMGMMRKMKSSPIMLLQMPDVKKELKLTGEQNKKIGVIQKEFLKATQEASKNSRSSDMSAFANFTGESDKASKAVLDALDPDQVKRVQQIQYQTWGYASLYEPEVQSELQLSSEQKSKISEWQDGESSRMAEAMQNGGGRDLPKKMKQLREASDATLLKILTSEQAAKFKELLGPPSNAAKRLKDQGF